MPDNLSESDSERRERDNPASSNHVIWGMTAGLLLGTALGFLLLDNVAVGVGIGIVLGAVLSMVLRGRVP